MNWQEYKKKYLAELLSDISKVQVKISKLGINIDDDEISDYEIKKELRLIKDRIDSFIKKIDSVTTKKEYERQQTLA